MNRREIKNILREGIPADPQMLEETQRGCRNIIQMQCESRREGVCLEVRNGFGQFLSGVFRFAGIRLWITHGIVLAIVLTGVWQLPGSPAVISFFMPLFAMACIPSFFENQIWGMGEIEAASRASGGQIMLAKLILAGMADLVCLTVFLGWMWQCGRYEEGLFSLILYALVPLLFCITAILWIARRNRDDGARLCAAFCAGILLFCILSGLKMSWLYRTSAVGIWGVAFFLSTVFFIREIRELIRIGKGGIVYGFAA